MFDRIAYCEGRAMRSKWKPICIYNYVIYIYR